MIVKQFRLSQPEKERLIRIKAKTGISNWNILCRWALCWSLAEPTVPSGIDPLSDSNVEMDWSTFAGEYAEIYESVIRQRCTNDGLGDAPDTLIKYFRLHLYRGINHYSNRDVLKNCQDLLKSALPKEDQ
jgi:DNA sulfur modification protein DndE